MFCQSRKDNVLSLKLLSIIAEIESALRHFSVVKHFNYELKKSLFIDVESAEGNDRLIEFLNNYKARWENINQRIAAVTF